MTRYLGLVLVAIVSLLTAPRPALAQDPPLVLVPGVRSNGTTWNDAQSRFSRQLTVTVYNPSLMNWRALFPDQATQLQQKLPGIPGVPVGMPGRATPRVFGRSRNSFATAATGTWPSMR